jgi:hypothetical protein
LSPFQMWYSLTDSSLESPQALCFS